MDISHDTNTTEKRVVIDMLQYYRDMQQRRSYVLEPITEAYSGPKGRKMILNSGVEFSFK